MAFTMSVSAPHGSPLHGLALNLLFRINRMGSRSGRPILGGMGHLYRQAPRVRGCVPFLHGDAGSDPRGHLGVTWGVYLCAGKPPLADIILSHPPDLTRCDSVIGWAIPAMSGHIQYRGTASGDLYIGISGINRVLLS